MGSNAEWITLVELTKGDEDRTAAHPFDDFSSDFRQIEDFMKHWRTEFPQFEDFRLEYCWKSHGRGAETNWFELQGLATTDLQKELYAK